MDSRRQRPAILNKQRGKEESCEPGWEPTGSAEEPRLTRALQVLASPGVLSSGLHKGTREPGGDDHRVSLGCASHRHSGPPFQEGYCPAPQQRACLADTPVTQAGTRLTRMDKRRMGARLEMERKA